MNDRYVPHLFSSRSLQGERMKTRAPPLAGTLAGYGRACRHQMIPIPTLIQYHATKLVSHSAERRAELRENVSLGGANISAYVLHRLLTLALLTCRVRSQGRPGWSQNCPLYTLLTMLPSATARCQWTPNHLTRRTAQFWMKGICAAWQFSYGA